MGDGVSLNSGNDKLKIDFKKLFDFRTSYAVETTVPNVELNGNGNWGQVGDGFELSNNGNVKTYATPEQVYGANSTPSSSNPSNGTDSEIEEGNAALNSSDVNVVRAAKTGVDALVSSPDAAATVTAANTEVTNQEGVVATNQESVGRATGEQEAAQGVEEAAEVTEEQSQTKVESQKADLQAKETNLTKAQAAETKAQANVTAAEATVTSAKASVESAKAAVESAKAGLPYSAAAVAAAEAALAAAEAALKTAEAKLEVAKAELEKATAEKEQATAERDKSKAQLEKDEEALKKAEEALTKAQEDVAAADEKLQNAKQQLETAQADLETKKTAYEAVKSDVQKQSSDLSKDLDKLLEELEDGEGAQNAAGAGSQNNSWLNKGQSVMNLFNQGMNGVKSLTGSAAAAGAEEEAEGILTNLQGNLIGIFRKIWYTGATTTAGHSGG